MLKVTEDALVGAQKAWEQVSVNGIPRDDVLVKIDAGVLRKLSEAYALELVTTLPAGITVPTPAAVATLVQPERPVPYSGFIGSHRTGNLQNMTAKKISDILGFKPNSRGDASKVVSEWLFTYKGVQYAIWDYKGSHRYGQYSTYGPSEGYRELFGTDYFG